jgi:glycosyltransferase involved in cell wall biosynthesis
MTTKEGGTEAATVTGSYDRVGERGLVSVVIPCYNQAHFLGEAIESVLGQTYKRHEIVVVDDGSTDATSEVAGRYSGVRLIRQDNRGLSRSRNAGIEHSEGEYLVFLDADDRLLPEALRTGVEYLDSHVECVFAFGHYRFIAQDGSPRAECRPPIHDDYYGSLLRRNFIGMHATVVYRRALFESVGGFDGVLDGCEDYDLYLRAARRFPIYNHARLVAEYRRYDGAMSRDSRRMLRTAIEVLRSQWKYARKSERYREAYKTGMRTWRTAYGIPLAKKVREQASKGNWKRAISGAWTLLRYYPGGLLLVPRGKYWIARELADRDKRLRQRNRKIRELKGTFQEQQAEIRRLKKQSRDLGEKRRQLRRTTEQNRRLTRRNQNLERRLQEIEESWSWKLAQHMGRVRSAMVAKVFHRGQPGPDPLETASEQHWRQTGDH